MRLEGTLELSNLTSTPTVVEGGIYYDATANKYYGSTDGATWTELLIAGGVLTTDTLVLTPIPAPTEVAGEVYYDSGSNKYYGSTDGAAWRAVVLQGDDLTAGTGTFSGDISASDATLASVSADDLSLTPSAAPSVLEGKLYYDSTANAFEGSDDGVAFYPVLLNGRFTRLDIEPLASAPTANEGSIYYDTTANKFYGSLDGVSWTEFSSGSGVLGDPVTIAHGGTNATTAAGARANLGTAASGSNSDITSLSALATPLSIAQGGTSASTASAARAALGTAASGSNSDITSLSALATPLSVPQGGTGLSSLPLNGLLYGDSSSPIASVTALTDGQLAIGSTGNPPVPANLTGGAGINILNGPGTITISATSSAKLSTTNSINGKAVAVTSLFTATQTTVVTGAVIRITVATGLTGTLTAGVGVAAGEDDIFASTVMTGFDATTKTYTFAAQGVTRVVAPSEIVSLGIDSAFGGTTVTLSVDLLGYEVV